MSSDLTRSHARKKIKQETNCLEDNFLLQVAEQYQYPSGIVAIKTCERTFSEFAIEFSLNEVRYFHCRLSLKTRFCDLKGSRLNARRADIASNTKGIHDGFRNEFIV